MQAHARLHHDNGCSPRGAPQERARTPSHQVSRHCGATVGVSWLQRAVSLKSERMERSGWYTEGSGWYTEGSEWYIEGSGCRVQLSSWLLPDGERHYVILGWLGGHPPLRRWQGAAGSGGFPPGELGHVAETGMHPAQYRPAHRGAAHLKRAATPKRTSAPAALIHGKIPLEQASIGHVPRPTA